MIDNYTLDYCLAQHQKIIFIFTETKSFKKASFFRRKFIQESLVELKEKLTPMGHEFLVTEFFFYDFLQILHKTKSLSSIYFTKEYAWDERIEEKLVEEFCLKNKILFHSFDQGTLIAQDDLPFKLEEMPFIFTDFRKKVEADLKIKAMTGDLDLLKNRTNKKPQDQILKGGESRALDRLHYYLWESKAILNYKKTRNGLINFDDSSKLSPWLNVGCLSPRTIFYQVKKFEEQVEKNESTDWLIFELLWRDYFKFFSLKFAHKIFLSTGIKEGLSPNEKNVLRFKLWCEGKTNDSFINANMNELNQTGWMSNRGRQNVASYLIHDLGIDWTWGASYFEKKLIDYDPDLNWGNWLYLSGRGSDPRARKFNTIKQAETYDPSGEYQKLWTKI